MNSYINLILDAEGAKERLRSLFQSTPKPEENHQLLSFAVVLKQRQRRKRSAGSKMLSTFESRGCCAVDSV
jgi:hypothetical protein